MRISPAAAPASILIPFFTAFLNILKWIDSLLLKGANEC